MSERSDEGLDNGRGSVDRPAPAFACGGYVAPGRPEGLRRGILACAQITVLVGGIMRSAATSCGVGCRRASAREKDAARYQGPRGAMGGVVGMRERGCASLGERRTLAVCLLLQCAGWGLFQSSLYGGSFYADFLGLLGVSWLDRNAAIAFLVAGTGAGCLACRSLARHGVDLTRPRALLVWYGAAFACFTAGAIVPLDGAFVDALSLAVGVCAAAPLLVWFKSWLGVYAQGGPFWCIMVIVLGNLVAMLVGLFAGTVSSWPIGFALLAAGSAGAALCQVGAAACGSLEADRAMRPGTYRLTLYAATVVMSFGMTWGLCQGILRMLNDQGFAAGSDWVFSAGGIVGCILVVLYALATRKLGSLRFGLFIRLALTFSGLACACMPLMSAVAPMALPILCRAVVVVQGAAMGFFSVEICHEKRLGIVEVMPLNYIVYVVVGCIAMGLPLMLGDCGLDGLLLWSALALVAVAATILVIPALPSSTSTAATFTLRELPENESYAARAAHARDGLVEKYGLTAREAEVLGLLVQGLNRNQIAERLALSSWTVKDHLTSIYAKTGVHSAKELLVLVAGGERGGAEREERG